MKTTIYYFTGTGNSLAVARKISSRLPGTDLVPMVSYLRDTVVPAPSGRIGFVFPVYYWSVPHIVSEFLKKLDLSDSTYLFAVVTMGGMQGATLARTDSIIKEKGKRLDAGFSVAMPGNYVALYDVADAEKQKKTFEKAEQRLDTITAAIRENTKRRIRGGPLVWFTGCISQHFTKDLKNLDTNFLSDDSCNGCGTCVRVCPVDNSTLEENRPVWHHHCETCFACINLCPVHAIQYGRKSRRFGRYRHPAVSTGDIIGQKEREGRKTPGENGLES